ncbi:hypothetical protein CK203_003181 [Vitis vinifera]|uniref:Uncharacterized protein n=1 Tax=Vitis vinifera TaxID=29760 RepID=A0A438K6X9_VITVI|nr:hypothetical protein CK203_003181 [Vitis vinifera]
MKPTFAMTLKQNIEKIRIKAKVGGKYKARTIPSRADQRSSLQGMTAENTPSMLYLNTSTLSYTHLNRELYHYYL